MPLSSRAGHDGALNFTIGDGTNVISTGTYYIDVHVPYDCIITGWHIYGLKESGSIVFDVWACDSASYPPTVANSITPSDKPTLSSARQDEGVPGGGWTTALNESDVVRINVDSVTSLTAALLVIELQRTS